jgi:hypothetical protein
MGRTDYRKSCVVFPELVYVCKKTKYETYPIAYAHASVADTRLTIYLCKHCNAYHLSSNTH